MARCSGRIRASVSARTSRESVHVGATSQDIVDTRPWWSPPILADDHRRPARRGAAGAALAIEHRTTPMAARTLLQQAAAHDLRAQGGRLDVGSRSGPPTSTRSGALRISRSNSVAPPVHWPPSRCTDGASVGRSPSGWPSGRPCCHGIPSGRRSVGCGRHSPSPLDVVMKVAGDVVSLAQTGDRQVAEGVAGRGGSRRCRTSRTRSPRSWLIATRSARSRASQVLLVGSMAQEHERAAGAACRMGALLSVLSAPRSAAAWLRDCLSTSRCDPDRDARGTSWPTVAPCSQSEWPRADTDARPPVSAGGRHRGRIRRGRRRPIRGRTHGAGGRGVRSWTATRSCACSSRRLSR